VVTCGSKADKLSQLYRWLRFYTRITLAGTMIVYGSFKVIQSQFPPPSLWRLLEPYGQSAPMALLWTLMGASKSYNLFTGLIEMIGGVLVIVPRFTTLGSLVLVGAISNVFVLNMSYDVAVKQYSFHLLLMCLFVVAPDLPRLGDFFIFNRRTEPALDRPLFKRKRLNQGALALKLALGALFVGSGLHLSYQGARTDGYLAPRPPSMASGLSTSLRLTKTSARRWSQMRFAGNAWSLTSPTHSLLSP